MGLVESTRAVPHRLRVLAVALAAEPVETVLYIPERARWLFDKQIPYDVVEDWGPAFHEMIGCPWPCPELEAFGELWQQVVAELVAKGLSVGRFTYGVYSDAEAGLTGAAWCAVRHLNATKVVETGVARGLTSRAILEALSLNGDGHLWSIDLPYLFGRDLHAQQGSAVPEERRDRWTYVRGSSRRRLRPLLAEQQPIDIFVHDSLHTERNMGFEMSHVWPSLRPGGVMLVDDVGNRSFRDFVERAKPAQSLVFRSTDSVWLFAAVRKATAG